MQDKEYMTSGFQFGEDYIIHYPSNSKLATYRGYADDIHTFWDGSGLTGEFGFSDLFIKSGRIKIEHLPDYD